MSVSKTKSNALSAGLSRLVDAYRWILSPMIHALAGPGMGCRFEPSCSHYMQQAWRTHGLLQGSRLGFRRLSRCHPWGGSGWDPVPSKEN